MKHKLVIAALMVTTLGASAGIPVSAATDPAQCEIQTQKGVRVITGSNMDEIKEKLESMGIDCSNIKLDCNGGTIQIPGDEQPSAEQPNQDSETPVAEQPNQDTDQPDQSESSYAAQVIALVNQERAKEGLAALQYDAALEKAANIRAKETEVSFSHTRPNGTSFSTVLQENGVSYHGTGENIAYGQQTPEEVMTGWMNSPGHRANIMNKNFTKIGVGFYESNGVKYWEQLFTYE